MPHKKILNKRRVKPITMGEGRQSRLQIIDFTDLRNEDFTRIPQIIVVGNHLFILCKNREEPFQERNDSFRQFAIKYTRMGKEPSDRTEIQWIALVWNRMGANLILHDIECHPYEGKSRFFPIK